MWKPSCIAAGEEGLGGGHLSVGENSWVQYGKGVLKLNFALGKIVDEVWEERVKP